MNRIKEALESKGLSQTWLAERLGKSYNMVNSYVKNRKQPRIEILFEIARLLSIDPRDLLNSNFNYELNNSEGINSRKLTFIDLFSGCGGLTEGFLSTNQFEALAHVEWELPMVNTLRQRLVNKWGHSQEEALKRVVHFDIQKTKELIFGNWQAVDREKFGLTNHDQVMTNGLKALVGSRKVDLIIGGPPCQAYSIAGRAQDKNSMKDDYRNYLFESFVEVVSTFKPKVFVFENVPGILSAQPGDIPITNRIYNAFNDIGYEVRTPSKLKDSIFTASDFGVPQKRNRVIIIGVERNSGLSVEETYLSIKEIIKTIKPTTVKDAIAHLPKLQPLTYSKRVGSHNVSHISPTGEHIKLHEPRYHNDRDVSIFRDWISKGMNRSSMDDKIDFYNQLMGKKSNHAKYRNLEWDKPSPTIVAHLHKDGLMFIHPDVEQARSITIKEAALLQSFPDDFDFVGSRGDAYKMIGNAVPPTMAKYIALGIQKVLNK